MSHELHNDFACFWKAAKAGEDSYGKGGLLEQSRAIEARADGEAAHMMYKAGWDPKAESEMMTRIVKLLRIQREGHRVLYSSHPEEGDRVAAITDRDAAAERRADRRFAEVSRTEEAAVGATRSRAFFDSDEAEARANPGTRGSRPRRVLMA